MNEDEVEGEMEEEELTENALDGEEDGFIGSHPVSL